MSVQTTCHLLMIRPRHFGYNEETAHDNAFQMQDNSLNPFDIQQNALKEFDNFVALLRAAGVYVTVIEDSEAPRKTDAVFPNNWISTHGDGTLITYPMYAPSRRTERRTAILEQLKETFLVQNKITLEHHEDEQRYLESTGSMILDRTNKMVYACHSSRTDEKVLDEFCQKMSYRKILFHAVDEHGMPIYHTNVMMALGIDFVIICIEAIRDAAEKKRVITQFEQTGKTIFSITFAQMAAFAGNMLQIQNKQGDSFLVMSQRAYESLDATTHITKLHRHTSILYSPLGTIEKYGGGSARCMMAEIFLPLKEPIIEKKERRGRGRKSIEATKTAIEKYIPGEGWIKVQ